MEASHLLKLVTGVETSTRPVRMSGSEGNMANRANLTAAAAAKRVIFRRSSDISSAAVERVDSNAVNNY